MVMSHTFFFRVNVYVMDILQYIIFYISYIHYITITAFDMANLTWHILNKTRRVSALPRR